MPASDLKITALTALTAADPANDVLPIVDVSDNSMAASGTTKKISINNILGASATATLASATISGDLTVDTSTLKVDSTNNRVGILTASPGDVLEVVGSGAAGLRVSRSGVSTQYTTISAGATGPSIDASSAIGALTFGVAGSTKATLDSSGNLGLGVTPSAWASGIKAFEFGILSSASDVGGTLTLASNTFRNSSGNWVYKTSTFASKLETDSSQFRWYNAAAGTAGNAITFTQAMTLDASGNLFIGKTSSNGANSGVELQTGAGGSTAGFFTAASQFALALNRTTTDGYIVDLRRQNSSVGNISVTTAGATFNSTSDYRLKESVAPLSGGLNRVNALKPSIYKWKADGSNGEGFLAHELAEVVPFAVTGEKDAVNTDGSIKPQGVDMSRVVPILVAAIQELTTRVIALENK